MLIKDESLEKNKVFCFLQESFSSCIRSVFPSLDVDFVNLKSVTSVFTSCNDSKDVISSNLLHDSSLKRKPLTESKDIRSKYHIYVSHKRYIRGVARKYGKILEGGLKKMNK